jgi:hypothetical protein
MLSDNSLIINKVLISNSQQDEIITVRQAGIASTGREKKYISRHHHRLASL